MGNNAYRVASLFVQLLVVVMVVAVACVVLPCLGLKRNEVMSPWGPVCDYSNERDDSNERDGEGGGRDSTSRPP